MARGKETCKILKEIRRQIAEANDIEFITSECHYKGDCLGTCPKCEAEVRYLEQQLRTRRLTGKAVALAGISAGVIMLSGCNGTSSKQTGNELQGEPQMEEKVIEKSDDAVRDGEIDDIYQTEGAAPRDEDDRKVTRVIPKFVPPTNQQTGDIEALPTEDVTVPKDSNLVGLMQGVDCVPEFPGGYKKMMDFLAANVKYPEAAVEGAISGRVVVQFTVKKDGSIDDIEVIRSVYPDLDEEAVRVVKLLPNFIPATIDGEAFDCTFTLPIQFCLQ